MTHPPSESSYIGRHAELYDLFYTEKKYAEEAQFIHQCIQQHGNGSTQHVLELACGTGRHALEMEKLGYKMIATDYSADMLSQARRKSAEVGSTVDFRQQDMRTLNVPEGPFDAIICLFDSIGYVATNENVLKVFESVHKHLKPGGLFIFEFWHAPAMLKNYEPVRVRRWLQPDSEVLRISETELDYARQLAHVSYTIYEFLPDQVYRTFKETQTNRFFLLQEMGALVICSGFEPIKAYNGFVEDELITDATWHVVMVTRRSSGL